MGRRSRYTTSLGFEDLPGWTGIRPEAIRTESPSKLWYLGHHSTRESITSGVVGTRLYRLLNYQPNLPKIGPRLVIKAGVKHLELYHQGHLELQNLARLAVTQSDEKRDSRLKPGTVQSLLNFASQRHAYLS